MNNSERKVYKVMDLRIHTYGKGRDKKFIIYTDFEQNPDRGAVWHTQVFPDIEGNALKAAKQAVKWLNGDVPEPWVVRNSPRKVSLSYNSIEHPEHLYETYFDGTPL